MKPDAFFERYAKAGYEGYGESTGHKNYQGLPMPSYEDLPEKQKRAWVDAVKAVLKGLVVRDGPDGEPWVDDPNSL